MSKNSKKIISLTLTAVLSAAVFVTTGFAASNNVSGYEKAKEALFELAAFQNFDNLTENLEFSVVEDGVEIINGAMNTKIAGKDYQEFQMNLTVDGESFVTESHSSGENTYTKLPGIDGYRKSQNYAWSLLGENIPDGLQLSDNEKKLANVVFDMFVGDTKNYFTNDNGEITMQLEKSQVPEVFQLGLTVMSESLSKEIRENPSFFNRRANDSDFSDFMEEKILNVLNGMAIDSVYAEGTIDDDNLITDAAMTFTLTGEDQDGNPHVTTFSMTNTITDVGTTVVEPFDETGKLIMDNDIRVPYDAIQSVDPAMAEELPLEISVDGEKISLEDLQAMEEEDFINIESLNVNGYELQEAAE
jgi:hypothetical protein